MAPPPSKRQRRHGGGQQQERSGKGGGGGGGGYRGQSHHGGGGGGGRRGRSSSTSDQQQQRQHHHQHGGSSSGKGGGGGGKAAEEQQAKGGDIHHQSFSSASSSIVSRGRNPSGSEVGGGGVRKPIPGVSPPPKPPTLREFYAAEDQLASQLTNEIIFKESNELISAMREMLNEAPESNHPKWQDQTAKDQLLIKALKLRRLSRLSNFRNQLLRENVNRTRERVEERFLQLANLKSENGHLRRAIDTCLEFQSADADIDLTPIEEFLANAPAEIKREEVTSSDEHQLHLARLNYELAERKNMVSNLQELEGRRSVLLSDIRGKEQRLSQVPKRINALKEAAQPLLELVGMSKTLGNDAWETRSRLERLLPKQLQPIYVQMQVYNRVLGEEETAGERVMTTRKKGGGEGTSNPLEGIVIGCEGSEEEATKFERTMSANLRFLNEDEEDDDAVIDEDEGAEEDDEETTHPSGQSMGEKSKEMMMQESSGPIEPSAAATSKETKAHKEKRSSKQRGSHHHKSTAGGAAGVAQLSLAERLGKKRQALLSVHPISLSVGIPLAVSTSSTMMITLHFAYAPHLECVTVKCRVEGGSAEQRKGNGLVDPGTLLDELFGGGEMIMGMGDDGGDDIEGEEKDDDEDIIIVDNGLKCPNEAGDALVQMFGVNLAKHVPTIGKPYYFAQKLAGLQSFFLNSSPSPMQHFEFTSECIRRVRQRVADRLQLAKLFQKVMAATIAAPGGSGGGGDYSSILSLLPESAQLALLPPPASVHCRVESFKAHLKQEEFSKLFKSEHPPNSLHQGALDEWEGTEESGEDEEEEEERSEGGEKSAPPSRAFLCSAMVVRGAFRLLVGIRIPVDYPATPSGLMMRVVSEAHRRQMEYVKGIWELERYVNAEVQLRVENVGNMPRSLLLPMQMAATLSRLDVVLELVSTQRLTTNEFEVKHLYAGSGRGRDQQFPFEFNAAGRQFDFHPSEAPDE